jgi:chromosome segregation protein
VKITRLRLSGFKSFVDPTELMIEPGRNGVVGPNGCGKSNLVEALRWVMGESSPKSMRGAEMDDVIFAGSSNRPSRNMAEVSVVLDNRARKAPSAFNGEDTLEITRRIEREAGSIYRINGREVRARDVQLLFADASTGAHSPALVRQGQIGELIAAKPRSRRLLLEEAAGISGLHSRRHEAELRLKAAETNLTRVHDLALQLEGQLASLRRQARQASRYRNISGEIRRLEARLLASRWQAAAQAIERVNAELLEAKHRVEQETERAARASTQELEAGDALPPLRDAEAKAAAALHRLTVERDMLEAEAKRAAEDLERLSRLLAQSEADLARENERLKDAEAAAQRLAAEKAGWEAAIGSEAQAIAEQETALAGAREALTAREAALDAATRAQADATARRHAFQRQIEEARRSLARLAEERAQLALQRSALEAETGQTGEADGLRAGLEEAAAQADKAAKGLVEAEAGKNAAAEAEQAAREPLQETDRVVARLAAEADAIAKLLGTGASDLWPPVIDAVSVEPGYEAALAAALGDELNVPADRAAPAHWDDLGPLPGSPPMLPDGAIVLSRFVKAPPALARRLGLIGVVTAEQGKTLQFLLRPGQRLVSRAGHLWRWDGYTVAAEAQTAEAARLAQRNRLEELKSEIAKAEGEARQRRDHYHALRLAAEGAAETERGARGALRDAEAAVARARARLAEAEKAQAASLARLSGLSENEARLARETETRKTALAEAESGLAGLPEEAALRAGAEAAREDAAEARLALSQAQSALEILRGEARRRADAIQSLARDLKGWTDREDEALRQIATLQSRASEAASERAALVAKPAEIEEKRLRLADILSEAGTLRSRAADVLAAAEAALKAAAQEARAAEHAVAEVRESRARLEATLAAAIERAEELRAYIREALECTAEELMARAAEEDMALSDPLEDLERKLERLKRERENLGGVNLRADEEANEIEAQLTTMLSEKADLDEAIAKLRQGIGKLNAEGRERLMAAFDIVNGHFRQLFVTLFGGGEAELRLVESDDPLEAGLEIFARPPGKKLQVMTLLSGGEQALTALSLIFAVFLSNPAPICVLDEVDAPLDDANVERFCNLVDEMTRMTDTRFLIITHHPLTMARMDRLYGVTMSERGVSQLVSVDLTEAVEVVRAAG